VNFQSALFLFSCTPAVLFSAEMQPDTVKAWDDYIQAAESRLRPNQNSPFLWTDQAPSRSERVRTGEVLAWAIHGKRPQAVPHGLIHDWIGAVFIPNVALRDVLAVAQNYDRYGKYYGPTVRDAKLLFRTGDTERFSIQHVRRVFSITVALDAEYDIRYGRLNDRRLYSAARSTCIQQIQNYGEPGQRRLPCDDESGLLWRASSFARLEERDQGVYFEQERIVLSREIPVSLRWLVEPVVNRLSRDLMITSLRRTRDAVLSAAQAD
jgi:hypothetical protein